MNVDEEIRSAAADERQAERRRTRPFVSFWTGVLYEPDEPIWADTREWEVQSAEGGECGGSFATLEEALVCARLHALQAELGWRLDYTAPSERVSVCWCGWTKPCAGCHTNDITAHVIEAHRDHPVVRG